MIYLYINCSNASTIVVSCAAGSPALVYVHQQRDRTKNHTPSAIILCGFSTHPLHVSTNAASSAPSTTRWSALQLTPTFNLLSPCPFSFLFTSHTHLARPIATIATPPPGTRTGLAKSPSPIPPTLDTVIVPPRFGISPGVRPHGTCRPRWEMCLSVDANEYTDCAETFRMVGV